MRLFDPARKYVNDKPVLMSFSGTVIPFLMIFPEREDNKVRVSAMIPASGEGRFTARQVSKIIICDDLSKILEAYKTDPESTLETLFDLELRLSEPSDEDLARSIKRDFKNTKTPLVTESLEDQVARVII